MFFFLAPIKWALKLFSLLIVAVALYVVVNGVQVVLAEKGTASNNSHAAAIVVVGSAAATATEPDGDLAGRLQHAAKLYSSGHAVKVVVALPGGAGGAARHAAVSGLEGFGVPAKSIETVVSSTASAFGGVAAHLGTNTSVIVVTDGVDVLWCRDAAASAGLRAVVSPVPGSLTPFYRDWGGVFREASGIAAGRLIGYHHVTWAAA